MIYHTQKRRPFEENERRLHLHLLSKNIITQYIITYQEKATNAQS